MMSGGPLERFVRGWAVRISFSSHPRKAHYYERDELSYAHALCGAGSVRVAALRGLGSWVKCKRCKTKIAHKTAEEK